MQNLLKKLKDPVTYLGLGTAASGFNWAAIAPMGTGPWWTALLVVVGGVAATIMKRPNE